ncbi:phosphatase PAP2 family protein [Lactococcus termiticola]|uniref:Membrane-associated phospholipid phosphatase n=1 Tax=Lactococcus termiticola TaxID=2169526 RepID=A0A2R5HJ50_9LACT|nr:phosphatase PAP2 family protein [Lactococcus termiticola]GBG96518.1 membrane-associated phospholipid phosphatase [Lactococcus termiticola]
MNQKESRFLGILFGAALLLLIVGSFADLSIGRALFDQNSIYGNIFQAYMMFPQALIPFIAGASVFHYGLKHEHPLGKAVMTISGAGFGYWSIWQGVDIWMSYTTSSLDNIKNHKPLGAAGNGSGEQVVYSFGLEALITLLLTLIGLGITYRWLANKTTEEFKYLLMVSVVAVAFIYLSESIVDISKANWGRWRPYEVTEVVNGSKGHFTDWWVINGKNGHRSFPSGHTIAGAAALFLPFYVDRKNIKLQEILAYAGLIFAFLMAFGRIRIGAHWMTDTMMSILIAGLTSLLLTKMMGLSFIEKAEKEMNMDMEMSKDMKSDMKKGMMKA